MPSAESCNTAQHQPSTPGAFRHESLESHLQGNLHEWFGKGRTEKDQQWHLVGRLLHSAGSRGLATASGHLTDPWLSVFVLVGLRPAWWLLISPCHKCIVMQCSSFSY
jgi:hypothetical protein